MYRLCGWTQQTKRASSSVAHQALLHQPTLGLSAHKSSNTDPTLTETLGIQRSLRPCINSYHLSHVATRAVPRLVHLITEAAVGGVPCEFVNWSSWTDDVFTRELVRAHRPPLFVLAIDFLNHVSLSYRIRPPRRER